MTTTVRFVSDQCRAVLTPRPQRVCAKSLPRSVRVCVCACLAGVLGGTCGGRHHRRPRLYACLPRPPHGCRGRRADRGEAAARRQIDGPGRYEQLRLEAGGGGCHPARRSPARAAGARQTIVCMARGFCTRRRAAEAGIVCSAPGRKPRSVGGVGACTPV